MAQHSPTPLRRWISGSVRSEDEQPLEGVPARVIREPTVLRPDALRAHAGARALVHAGGLPLRRDDVRLHLRQRLAGDLPISPYISLYLPIFGNVSQVIASIDATGSRYRDVMENMNAFLRTHAVPASLQRRVRQHVESTFSENKGIDVQSITNQLPSHLQVEVFYHLNLAMLRRVDVLRSCHQPFLKHLVTRLQFSLVSCGQYASRVRLPLLGVSFLLALLLAPSSSPSPSVNTLNEHIRHSHTIPRATHR